MKTFSSLDKDKFFTGVLWGVLLVLFVLIIYFSLHKRFDRDELETLHASWKILSGERIYTDFFEHHHPFFYYLLTPVILIFKESIAALIAARVFVYVLLILIFLVTYDIARKLYGKEIAVISLILLATTRLFVFNALEIRPDVPQVLFGLLSLSFLFNFFNMNSLKWLILSSIFLGISFLFLQKSIFLAFTIGVLISLAVHTGQIKLRNAFLYLIGFIVTLMPYYAYLLFTGQWHVYYLYNWAMNAGFLQYESSRGINIALRLMLDLKNNPLLWFFWIISLRFLGTSNQERMGITSLFILIIFILAQFPSQQYLMLLMPLLAMMAAHAIYKTSSHFPRIKIFVVSLVLVIYVFYPLGSDLEDFKPNGQQLRRIKQVLSITKPVDFVYDGKNRFNLFRKDLDFFWFSLGERAALPVWFKNKTHYHYDLYELIDKFKPKVISKYQIWDLNDDRIVKYYQTSTFDPDLLIRIN